MGVLKLGSRGQAVKDLQKKLSLAVDGIFGTVTLEAVKDFQKSHTLKVDGIVGPATQKALDAVAKKKDAVLMSDGLKRTSRKINKIILHCTATGTAPGQGWTVERLREVHVKERGWSDIGYHYVIYSDGTLHEGRNIDIVGAHCKEQNVGSIAIAYCGGVGLDGTPADTRSIPQRKTMHALVRRLLEMYNLKIENVHCHNEYAAKACPSFNIKTFRGEYEYHAW